MKRIASSVPNSTRINVTIDRLVLRGLDPAARTSLVDGLRSELAHVLSDPSTRTLPSSSHSLRIPVLRLPNLPLYPGISGARNLGRTVARAIGAVGTTAKGGRS